MPEIKNDKKFAIRVISVSKKFYINFPSQAGEQLVSYLKNAVSKYSTFKAKTTSSENWGLLICQVWWADEKNFFDALPAFCEKSGYNLEKTNLYPI